MSLVEIEEQIKPLSQSEKLQIIAYVTQGIIAYVSIEDLPSNWGLFGEA